MSINTLNASNTPYPLGATSLIFGGKSSTGNYNYTAGLTAGNYVMSAVSLDNNTYTGSYYIYTPSDGLKRTVLNGGNTYLQLSASDSNVAFRPSVALANTFTTTNRQLYALTSATITNTFPSFQNITATGLIGIVESTTNKFYKSTTSSSNWTLSTFPAVTYDFTYGAGVYVAVGVDSIYYSTDATTWTIARTFANPSNTLYGVRFVNNVFIAAGRGSAYTSTDGITWTTSFQGLPITSSILAGTYFNSLHIAATSTANSLVYISTDNQIWTSSSLPSSQATQTNSVYSDVNEVLFGANNNTIFKSTNGTTWTAATTNFSTSVAVLSVNKLNGTYVATAGNGQLSTSTDLTTWTARAPQFGVSAIQGTAYGAGVYVAVGAGGRLTSSTDLITWTARTSQFGASSIQAVTFGNGLFVAAGGGGRITYSTDGTTWVAGTGTGATGFVRVYWDGTYFNASGTAVYYYSTNAATWTAATTGITGAINTTYKVGSNNYAIGANATTNYLRSISTNNITWNRWTKPLDNTFYSGITYTNSLYVLCGTATGQTLASVITSTDLVNWTERLSTTSSNVGLRTIAKATTGNTIVLAGNNTGSPSGYYSSTDGITYSAFTASNSQVISYATAGNGYFVLVGSYDNTNNKSGLYSTDGTTWTDMTVLGTASLVSAIYTGTGFLAMSGDSSLYIGANVPSTWVAGPFTNYSDNYQAAFGNGTIVVAAQSGYYYSTNGSNFIDSRTTSGTTVSPVTFNKVTYGNGKFVAANASTARTSTNGFTWSSNSFPASATPSASAYSSAYGLYYMAASNASGSIYWSTDGVTWGGPVGAGSVNYTAIATGPNRTIATGYSGAIYAYNTDGAGKSFTSGNISSYGGTWAGAAYGNGLYVLAGTGQFAYSTTGGAAADWTAIGVPDGNTFSTFYYSAGYFYWGVNTGSIYASTNIITWTLVDSMTVAPISMTDYTNTLYTFFNTTGTTFSVRQGTSSASLPTGYYLYRSNLGALV